jgi:group I intron endonuclease
MENIENRYPNKPGIYAIIHKDSGKRYIGSARNMSRRIQAHKRKLIDNKHPNKHLQAAWMKYGQGSFMFCIIEHCMEKDLLQREQFHIDDRAELNLSPTAGRTSGIKYNESVRIANSNRVKKLWADPKYREKLMSIGPIKGGKISIAKKGMPGGMTGKKHSEETKAKIRAAHTGMKMSPEARENNRRAQTGKKMSPESIEKTAAANRGHKMPKPTKEKLAIARANFTHEQRSAQARKAWETKKLRGYEAPKHTEESKIKMKEVQKRRNNLLSPEAKKLRAYKAWETKRAKAVNQCTL